MKSEKDEIRKTDYDFELDNPLPLKFFSDIRKGLLPIYTLINTEKPENPKVPDFRNLKDRIFMIFFVFFGNYSLLIFLSKYKDGETQKNSKGINEIIYIRRL